MKEAISWLLRDVARWTGIDLSRDARDGALMRFIDRRVRVLGLPSARAYVVERLSRPGDPEVRLLLSDITVNHTWFYRDPAQMEQIAAVLSKPSGTGKPAMRIWVPGCATGEDAYTVAMLGIAAGCPVAVLGTDLSERAIAHALLGRYHEDDAREVPAGLREHLVGVDVSAGPVPAGRCVEVTPALRRDVRFQQHNLLDAPPPGPGFHLILCRNVLIYFGQDQVQATVERLGRALLPGGWLFLGAGEVLRAVPRQMEWVALLGRYALRRLGEAPPPAAAPADAKPAVPLVCPTSAPAPFFDSAPCIDDLLAAAHEHFGAGAYAAALVGYGEVLTFYPARVEALLFSGIAHHLLGNPSSAEPLLKGALAVDPDLWPAAFYLARIYDQIGKSAAAQRAYQRVVECGHRALSLGGPGTIASDLEAWRRDIVAAAQQRLHGGGGRFSPTTYGEIT